MDLQLFFGFSGRINRARYWSAVALLFILMLPLALLQYGLALMAGNIVAVTMSSVASIAGMFSGFALGAKRLHDRDRSGWWQLFHFLPFLIVVPAMLIKSVPLMLAGIAFGVTVGIWLFLEIGCLRGTVGLNRFGPDPLEQEARLAT
jgi:uncharacterized membrane protein YhaH (DUF805 family)